MDSEDQPAVIELIGEIEFSPRGEDRVYGSLKLDPVLIPSGVYTLGIEALSPLPDDLGPLGDGALVGVLSLDGVEGEFKSANAVTSAEWQATYLITSERLASLGVGVTFAVAPSTPFTMRAYLTEAPPPLPESAQYVLSPRGGIDMFGVEKVYRISDVPRGTATTVFFAFNDGAYDLDGFDGIGTAHERVDFTEAEKETIRAALKETGSLAGLTFIEQETDPDNRADMILTARTGGGGRAYLGGGHLAVGTENGIELGADGFQTVLHEIGHSLGLSHPWVNIPLPKAFDNEAYTVMSYTSALGQYPQRFQAIDQSALAEIYGARRDLDHHWNGDYLTIRATSGADLFAASKENDRVRAGDGADTIFGLGGDDTLRGGGGNDHLEAGNGNDILRGMRGADSLVGHYGDDTLFGGSGADVLRAVQGRDVLVARGGRDSLYGDDYTQGTTFVFRANVNEGRNRVFDFQDGPYGDRIALRGSLDMDQIDIRPWAGGAGTRVDLPGGTIILLADVAPSRINEADFLLDWTFA